MFIYLGIVLRDLLAHIVWCHSIELFGPLFFMLLD